MRYLFFDIECANCFGGKGKICSLGYVACDNNFNILEQKDLLINPDSKFHLSSKATGEGIELGYPKETFLKSPKFDYFYSFIKELLEDEESVILGHSVINDINFLIAECNRYKKPYFTFKAFDTQILHRHFMPESKENGLGKICESFGIETENLHRSDYDAYLTMQVAKKLCEMQNVRLDELLSVAPNCYYSVDNGVVVNHYSTTSYTKKLVNIAKFVKPDPRLSKNTLIRDKHFSFSTDFEQEKYKQAMLLVKYIRWKGGYYSQKVSKTEYFLKYGRECQRTQNMQSNENVTVLDEDKLVEMLGIDKRVYEQVQTWSFSKIKNYNLGLPEKVADIS